MRKQRRSSRENRQIWFNFQLNQKPERKQSRQKLPRYTWKRNRKDNNMKNITSDCWVINSNLEAMFSSLNLRLMFPCICIRLTLSGHSQAGAQYFFYMSILNIKFFGLRKSPKTWGHLSQHVFESHIHPIIH